MNEWNLPQPAGWQAEPEVAHVWLASLDVPPARLASLRALLTDEERAGADRFHQPQHRIQRAAARGLVREILGRALGIQPAEVRFQHNAHGKPSLAGAAADSGLRFNLSHSHGWAVFALAQGSEIGVDLEKVRPDFATVRIAERFFARAESERLRALSDGERVRAFFECWTRKEAYVKARGDGLTRALGSFEVDFGPDRSAAIIRAEDDPDAATRWLVCDLAAREGFAGALVVERPVTAVRCWRLE